jgi:hypothetical protein
MRFARPARQSKDETHDRRIRGSVDGGQVNVADHAAAGTAHREPAVTGKHGCADRRREGSPASGGEPRVPGVDERGGIGDLGLPRLVAPAPPRVLAGGGSYPWLQAKAARRLAASRASILPSRRFAATLAEAKEKFAEEWRNRTRSMRP